MAFQNEVDIQVLAEKPSYLRELTVMLFWEERVILQVCELIVDVRLLSIL
jgi:hypothetical protein